MNSLATRVIGVTLTTLFLLIGIGAVSEAQTVTVKVPKSDLADGKATVDLRVNIVVTGGSVTPPPVAPQPPVTPPTNPGTCKRVPNVKVVGTPMPTRNFAKTYWRVAPKEIYAFSFKTADTTRAAASRAATATVSGSDGGKRLEISRCPGGTPVPRCSAFGAETSSVNYYINVNAGPYTCLLEPGTRYYANVYSKYRTTDSRYNCGTSASLATGRCAFLYNQQ